MSYYESNYYRNPGPVYGPGGDFTEPVPGWGPLPNMAGPRRVGVGATTSILMAVPGMRLSRPPSDGDRTSNGRQQQEDEGTGRPWWAWALVAATVGAAVGVAKKRGML